MKQKQLHILTVLVTLLLPNHLWADNLKKWDTFKVDGITYMVASKNPLEVNVGPSQYIGDESNWDIQEFGAVPKDTMGSIIIPSSVIAPDGQQYAVTGISMNAFTECEGITSIAIPNTITNIGSYAFRGCKGLTSVTIPSSVKTIEYLAFGLCDELSSVVFDNSSPISIRTGMFAGSIFNACGKLTSVYIKDLSAWCGNSFTNQNDSPVYWASHCEGKKVHLFVNGVEVKVINLQASSIQSESGNTARFLFLVSESVVGVKRLFC